MPTKRLTEKEIFRDLARSSKTWTNGPGYTIEIEVWLKGPYMAHDFEMATPAAFHLDPSLSKTKAKQIHRYVVGMMKRICQGTRELDEALVENAEG